MPDEEMNPPARTYQPIQFRIDSQERFFLWYEMTEHKRDPDRVVLDPRGDLLTFQSIDAVMAFAGREGLDVEAAVGSMSFDFRFD